MARPRTAACSTTWSSRWPSGSSATACRPVATLPVSEPGPADVPVVGPGGDELGERELREAAGLRIRQVLGLGYGIDQAGWNYQPAQPHSRRQGLTDGAGVDDVLGGQRLQGANRLAVVAELPVVVVLDDQ